MLIVEHNRPADTEVSDGTLDIGRFFSKWKFRGVNADQREVIGLIAVVPFPQVGECAQAVDAGVIPNIKQQHMILASRGAI